MSAAEDLKGMDPLTVAFGWGHLKDHWQKCDDCCGTGKDGDGDAEGPADDCPACDGAGRLRWGSFYHQDRERCAYCQREDVAIAQMYEGASGCGDDWVCLPCYVEHHQDRCGCKRWKKAEKMLAAKRVTWMVKRGVCYLDHKGANQFGKSKALRFFTLAGARLFSRQWKGPQVRIVRLTRSASPNMSNTGEKE